MAEVLHAVEAALYPVSVFVDAFIIGNDDLARTVCAASAFFARTIEKNGWPEKVVIDKSGANLEGLQSINWLLLLQKGFKSFQSASATLDGVEVAHMIRKHQFPANGQSAFQQFAAHAA
ncbi:hypothetical protein AX761_07150 [Rhizobium sp. 58]|nr:hypothetical protein AX761_07150 [Rhizobium sp. 58]